MPSALATTAASRWPLWQPNVNVDIKLSPRLIWNVVDEDFRFAVELLRNEVLHPERSLKNDTVEQAA